MTYVLTEKTSGTYVASKPTISLSKEIRTPLSFSPPLQVRPNRAAIQIGTSISSYNTTMALYSHTRKVLLRVSMCACQLRPCPSLLLLRWSADLL